MADEARTEEPTPRKLRRARERGEVPQSRLASAALLLLGVTAVLTFTAADALDAWRRFVERTWTPAFVAPQAAIEAASDVAASALAWPLAAAVMLGALGSALQVGPLFTVKPLAPRRLDLARGLSRVLSPSELAPRLGGLALAALVLAIAGGVVASALPGIAGRTDLDARAVLSASGTVLSALFVRVGAVFAVAGAIAIVYRRVRHLREQRMSRHELRQEQRETEGEPHAKRRRAEAHRERALGPTIEEALEGAAIVVRGGGVAIVLCWREGSDDAPEVSLVARGALAQRVVAEAARSHIAIAHDELLAHELARLTTERPLARPSLVRLARHLARAR